MRTIQSNIIIMSDQNKTFGLFYTSLTIHGQLMFFGFVVYACIWYKLLSS